MLSLHQPQFKGKANCIILWQTKQGKQMQTMYRGLGVHLNNETPERLLGYKCWEIYQIQGKGGVRGRAASDASTSRL